MTSPPKRPAQFGYATPSGERPFFFIDYGWEDSVERAVRERVDRPPQTINQDQIDAFAQCRSDVGMYQGHKTYDPRTLDPAWSTIGTLLQRSTSWLTSWAQSGTTKLGGLHSPGSSRNRVVRAHFGD
jgi:hypothetical protein